ALRAHRGSKCLVDNRKKAIKSADQAWITEDWLSRAVGAGLRLTAIVEPETGPATMTIKEIEVRYFSTVVRAAEWLTAPRAAVSNAASFVRRVARTEPAITRTKPAAIPNVKFSRRTATPSSAATA